MLLVGNFAFFTYFQTKKPTLQSEISVYSQLISLATRDRPRKKLKKEPLNSVFPK